MPDRAVLIGGIVTSSCVLRPVTPTRGSMNFPRASRACGGLWRNRIPSRVPNAGYEAGH